MRGQDIDCNRVVNSRRLAFFSFQCWTEDCDNWGARLIKLFRYWLCTLWPVLFFLCVNSNCRPWRRPPVQMFRVANWVAVCPIKCQCWTIDQSESLHYLPAGRFTTCTTGLVCMSLLSAYLLSIKQGLASLATTKQKNMVDFPRSSWSILISGISIALLFPPLSRCVRSILASTISDVYFLLSFIMKSMETIEFC